MDQTHSSPPSSAREAELLAEIKRYEANQERLERKIRGLEFAHQLLDAMTLGDASAADTDKYHMFTRLLLEACPFILIFFDEALRYVMGTGELLLRQFATANVHASELEQLTLNALFAGAMPPAWIEELEKNCAHVLQSRAAMQYHAPLPLYDGSKRHYSITISPAIDHTENARALVLLMYDVTELTAAKDQAETASRAKSNFLSNMSHEIHMSMNAILGMSNLLNLTELNEQQRGYMKNILAASDSLISLTNDILDFSRMDAQKFKLMSQRYNLADLISDVANTIGLRAAEKNLSFIADIDPSLPSVLIGDDLRIRQVLTNILTNAVKYTPRGIVKLAIEFVETKHGIDLLISVSDTGVGIKQEDVPCLFAAFSQQDLQKNIEAQGTGLGLAISKAITDSMGGELFLESEYGKGTIISIRIPQRVASDIKIAHLEHQSQPTVLIFGTGPSSDALEQMLSRLHVKADYAKDQSHFRTCLHTRAYSHLFYWQAFGHELVMSEQNCLRNTRLIAVRASSSVGETKEGGAADILFEPLLIYEIVRVLKSRREDAEQPMPAGQSPGSFEVKGAVALVVDDNEINLLVAAEMLKTYGLKADIAESGQAAIDLCQVNRYAIIFMDHMMPEMDGLEATQGIRAINDWYREVPIVALTASALTGARELFLAHTMNDYLGKPISVDELNRVLLRWLPPECVAPQTLQSALHEPMRLQSDKLQQIIAQHLLSVFDALHQIGGSEETFLAILRTFHNNVARKMQLLSDFLCVEDWEGYHIEIHSHKSALGNIGAKPLSEKARKLEHAVMQRNFAYAHENTDLYIREVLSLCEALQPILSTESEPVEKKAASQEDGIKLLEKLPLAQAHLDMLESEHALAEINGLLRIDYGDFTNQHLATIREAIENFDYDTASILLLALLTQWKEGNLHA